MTWYLEVWQFVSHHFLCNFMIFVTMPYELEMTWIFACWIFWMLSMLVSFPGIFECISYLFENFSPVCPIVNLLWVMISYVLWNSGGLLDGLEIWHVYYRHLEVCHGFGFTHLSCLVSVLCFLEVDAWFNALYELVWVCFGLMNLIELLPFVQMAWNLVWLTCYECCLIINFLRIYWNLVWLTCYECCLIMIFLKFYWNVLILIWLWSFCLVL